MCIAILFFFFNDTATTEIYTLSLHDALPIFRPREDHGFRPRYREPPGARSADPRHAAVHGAGSPAAGPRRLPRRPLRSEEHTSELQSRQYLVCRLLLEKKKKTQYIYILYTTT